jgi:hypothetical protein
MTTPGRWRVHVFQNPRNRRKRNDFLAFSFLKPNIPPNHQGYEQQRPEHEGLKKLHCQQGYRQFRQFNTEAYVMVI